VTVRRHHLLALAPVVGILGAPWFANRVEPRVLGMPFLLAWIVAWVILASAVMAIIGAIDARHEGRAAQQPGTEGTHVR
jgi:hypothetical protein